MPFGDTAKKIQRVTTIVEESYERLNQLVGQLQDLRDRVEATSDQIETMDRELAEQRAIVEALADQQGVDVDAIVAEVSEQRAAEVEESADDADSAPSSEEIDDGENSAIETGPGETAVADTDGADVGTDEQTDDV